METRIELDEIIIEVVRKRIRNIHLKIYSPNGDVKISAPLRMSLSSIHSFAVSKLDWIRKHQRKIRERADAVPPEYLNKNNYFVRGECYKLEVIEKEAPPKIVLENGSFILHIRPGTSEEKREIIIEDWYRDQLKNELVPLIEKWEEIMGVKVRNVFIQHMKTKWGSCNYIAGNIRINTELAKRPLKCLEYVVVHELAHLLERSHNGRFKAIMNQFLPNWSASRDELNRFPIRQ